MYFFVLRVRFLIRNSAPKPCDFPVTVTKARRDRKFCPSSLQFKRAMKKRELDLRRELTNGRFGKKLLC